MKILKIAFKNINSLRGQHEIDFSKEPFLQNSLFAITGPTGSGKTTILDVISLALFNQVPRLGKLSTTEVLKKGAILTRNQKEAYAQITYECKQGVFISKWEITTARTGKLKEYHMELGEINSGFLDLKKSEVPAKNEELIGLSYDQFIKSVVLAQGEFAKFLKVPKKERGALLEKITGTQIYRRIGQEAFFKYNQVKKETEEKRLKIETFKDQLLADEVYKEKKLQAEKLEIEKKNLNLSIEKNAKAIQLKKDLKKQQETLFATQEKIKDANTKISNFDTEKGKKLKKHEEIQLFSEDLDFWKNLKKEQKNHSENIATYNSNLKTFKEKQSQLQIEFSTIFQLNITSTNASEKLTNYKREVRDLITERNELLSIYKTSEQNISSLIKGFQFTAKPSNTKQFLQELEDKQNKKSFAFNKLNEKFKLQQKPFFKWEEEILLQLKLTRAAEKEEIALNNYRNNLKDLKIQLEDSSKKIENLPQQIEKLQADLKLKNAQLDAKQKTLEVEQLKKQLEDYRSDLVDNEPCPLCGSTHHPYASEHPKIENHLKIEVEELLKAKQQVEKQLIREETQLQQFTQQKENLQKEIMPAENLLAEKEKAFENNFTAILQQKETYSFSEMETNLENELEELNQAKKLKEDLDNLTELTTKVNELAELIAKGLQKKDEIKHLFKGSDFENEINKTENLWNSNEQSIVQQQKLLQNTEKDLAEVNIQLEKIDIKLSNQLKEKGYTSIEEALSFRLTASIAQAWQKEREQLQQKVIELKTLQQKLNVEIELLQQKDNETSLEKLKEVVKNENELLAKNENDLREILRLLKNQAENLQEIEKLQDEVGTKLKQTEHWKVLNDLIGDKTGNKFNDFAQNLTLAQLLLLANKRLVHLSDRYRIDQPTDDEDDSLVAIDEHMDGQRRSIKTLSGGETFILSLALALALSDLASRNIEINSLFIDEGFGTLDPETLDQTLDTLEVLQAESSKMIGVISHVDSLKERIATQIQLTQNGQGYSSLTIV